ncbi:MAG: thiol:disulfide interchange protein DsbA/DsbL [Proteobacteria bacterium]|nr:thiol:disulfide interchange protein DsbA/DsbL [Pseudomonadota bacterium]
MRTLGGIVYVAILVLGLMLVYSAYAANGPYIEGKHYQRLPASVEQNDLVKDLLKEGNGKVQVLEFFSYGCSWCFKLDPYIEKWRKTMPTGVSFQRVPVEFHPTWATLTKAYYTEVELNAVDKVHTALFDAIQTERIKDSSEDSLKQFFVDAGISAQDFSKTFNSFEVTRKQKWAVSIAQAYRITAVPCIVVQGPKGIFLSAVRFAGSEDELIKVLNELIKQAQ